MKILVLGAGGPAGVNTLRALRAAGHDLYAADDNEAHLIWCEPFAEVSPIAGTYDLAREVDLVIAQPDGLVRRLADSSPDVPRFLPSLETIDRCQDKLAAIDVWGEANLRSSALPLEAPWPDYLHMAEDLFGSPFWLRASRGAGARGAVKVEAIEQGYHWIRFWEARGAEIVWLAEEYLPGDDLAWSSIWHDGVLITSFLRERLEYVYPHLSPEGLTGTPAVARIVHDEEANLRARLAVEAIDENPHGIYSVDLRRDAGGIARPTEINAGRGFTTFGLWSMYELNFLDLYVRLGVEGPVLGDVAEFPEFDALPDGLTLSRHIDCPATFSPVRAEVLA